MAVRTISNQEEYITIRLRKRVMKTFGLMALFISCVAGIHLYDNSVKKDELRNACSSSEKEQRLLDQGVMQDTLIRIASNIKSGKIPHSHHRWHRGMGGWYCCDCGATMDPPKCPFDIEDPRYDAWTEKRDREFKINDGHSDHGPFYPIDP